MSEALSPSACEELIRRADQEVHGLDKNALVVLMAIWIHLVFTYPTSFQFEWHI